MVLYSQVNFAFTEEKLKNKGVQKCDKRILLVKKAQTIAHRNSANRNNQYYLFVWLCHGQQTIFSALWGQNQNRIKIKISQTP